MCTKYARITAPDTEQLRLSIVGGQGPTEEVARVSGWAAW